MEGVIFVGGAKLNVMVNELPPDSKCQSNILFVELDLATCHTDSIADISWTGLASDGFPYPVCVVGWAVPDFGSVTFAEILVHLVVA